MSCLPGICTISLGRTAAGHSLRHRLDMAQSHGFKGIELFHEDLVSIAEEIYYASSIYGAYASLVPPSAAGASRASFQATPVQELAAARSIKRMCEERDLSIICLQPFWQYEGLIDRGEHQRQLTEKLPLWFQLAEALGTDLIQVPSNFLPAEQLSGDFDLAVKDLQQMAEAGLAYGGHSTGVDANEGLPTIIVTNGESSSGNAFTDGESNDIGKNNKSVSDKKRVIRFAYEALAWGTHCDTWEQAWQTVLSVDRPNFGLLLDTFNLAGSRVFADPATASPQPGLVPNAHEKLRKSLHKLVREVDVEKVFYVQIAGAEKLAKPLIPGHELYVPDQPARMSWSRSCRLFYGEEGIFGGDGDTNDNNENSISAAASPSATKVNNAESLATADEAGSKQYSKKEEEEEEEEAEEEEEEEYLPISDVARAIFEDLGFRGWVSMEVFNRRAWDRDSDVPREMAARAALGWEKLSAEFGLTTDNVPER